MSQSDVGLIGLGTMGAILSRKIAEARTLFDKKDYGLPDA